MKAESAKALNNLSTYVQSCINDENVTVNILAENVLKELTRIVRIENPMTKNPKFNLYKYVSMDKGRPVMCGVFHDEGVKVASDARILVAIKEDYPKEYEGRVLYKDGHFYDENNGFRMKYPNYKGVFPKELESYEKHQIDFEKFREFASECKSEIKLGMRLESDCTVKVGKAHFSLSHFTLLVNFMQEIGTDIVRVHESVLRAAYVEGDLGRGVLMPLANNEENNDRAKTIVF